MLGEASSTARPPATIWREAVVGCQPLKAERKTGFHSTQLLVVVLNSTPPTICRPTANFDGYYAVCKCLRCMQDAKPSSSYLVSKVSQGTSIHVLEHHSYLQCKPPILTACARPSDFGLPISCFGMQETLWSTCSCINCTSYSA